MEEHEEADRKTQREHKRHILQQHRADALLHSPRPVSDAQGRSFLAGVHGPGKSGYPDGRLGQVDFPWLRSSGSPPRQLPIALEEPPGDVRLLEAECLELAGLLELPEGPASAEEGPEQGRRLLAGELEQKLRALGSQCESWHRQAVAAEAWERRAEEAHVGLAACEQTLCDAERWRAGAETAEALREELHEARLALAARELGEEGPSAAPQERAEVQAAREALAACERRLHDSEQRLGRAEAAQGLEGQEAREALAAYEQRLRDSEHWREQAEAAKGLEDQVQGARAALTACEQRLRDSERRREQDGAVEVLEGKMKETQEALSEELRSSEGWKEEAELGGSRAREAREALARAERRLLDSERRRERAEASEASQALAIDEQRLCDSEHRREHAEAVELLQGQLQEARGALAAGRELRPELERWRARAEAAERLEAGAREAGEALAACEQRLAVAEEARERAAASRGSLQEARTREVREALAECREELSESEAWRQRAEAAEALEGSEAREGREEARLARERGLRDCERWRELEVEASEELEARAREGRAALAACRERLLEARDQWRESEEVQERVAHGEQEAALRDCEQQLSAVRRDLCEAREQAEQADCRGRQDEAATGRCERFEAELRDERSRSGEEASRAAAKALECTEYQELLSACRLERGESHRELERLRERADRSLGTFAEEQVRMSRQRGELADELHQLRGQVVRASLAESDGWAAAREEALRTEGLRRECAELRRHVVEGGAEVLRLNLQGAGAPGAHAGAVPRSLQGDDWLRYSTSTRSSARRTTIDESRLNAPLWDGIETLRENATGALDALAAGLAGGEPAGEADGKGQRRPTNLLDAGLAGLAELAEGWGRPDEPPAPPPAAAAAAARQSKVQPDKSTHLDGAAGVLDASLAGLAGWREGFVRADTAEPPPPYGSGRQSLFQTDAFGKPEKPDKPANLEEVLDAGLAGLASFAESLRPQGRSSGAVPAPGPGAAPAGQPRQSQGESQRRSSADFLWW